MLNLNVCIRYLWVILLFGEVLILDIWIDFFICCKVISFWVVFIDKLILKFIEKLNEFGD